MGYDISNHAVDTALFTERLVPAVLGQNISIDDLLDRATDVACVTSRANQWGLRVLQLSHDFSTEQLRADAETFVGLNFNSDLYIWGRPFFITGDSVDESLDAFARYLACTRHDLSAVDRIAEEMVTRLDAKKPPLPPDPTKWEMKLERMHPLAAHLPQLNKAEERKDADPVATRARLAAMFDLCKEAWAKRASKTKIKSVALEEPARAHELAPTVPYILLNLASQTLPGWMGRGLVWPTQLFEKIGVPVAHIFEPPTALFEPLVRALPAIEESFGTTIRQNYSLGGYVRPEKVSALRELLQKHERDLVYAWCSPEDIEKGDYTVLSTDYRKIIEPVVFAERNRYGFIEAAEVYSGILGVTN